jgi:ribose/xylose/arabinose/galactoside ABC-type transport system permease subunit
MNWYVLRKFSPLIILAAVLILARILTTGFFNIFNLSVILTMTSILGFLALGETMVIFTRGFDLSVGNVASMSTVIVAAVMKVFQGAMPDGIVMVLAALLALAAGAVVGLINGAAVVGMKIPPFIATMGGMWIATGVAFLILRGVPTRLTLEPFTILGSGGVWFFPIVFIVLVGVTLVLQFFMSRTAIGARVYSAGGNDYAAHLSGISVSKVRLLVYMLSGIFAAMGGIFLSAYTASGFPKAAEGYELLAIASVVIGGVSLFGGAGSIWGALAGAATLQVLDKIIVYRGISPFISQMIIGIILLAAVYFTTRRKGLS